jgi:hypothetical protein
MEAYYPFGDFFIKEAKKANSFLSKYSCNENVHIGEWEVSITYKNEDFIIKHSFGDKETYFNTLVGIAQFNFQKYGLWEWIAALKIDWPIAITGDFIGSENELGQLIQSSAKCLEENLSLIVSVKKPTIKLMDEAREETSKDWYKKR